MCKTWLDFISGMVGNVPTMKVENFSTSRKYHSVVTCYMDAYNLLGELRNERIGRVKIS